MIKPAFPRYAAQGIALIEGDARHSYAALESRVEALRASSWARGIIWRASGLRF